MEKSEALERFLKKEAKAASVSFLSDSLERLKKGEKREHVEALAEDFRVLLQRCHEKNSKKGASVRFLQISLLRSRALAGRPFYILEAFRKDFYLSGPVALLELNVRWLYERYQEYCRELEQQSRRYILQIQDMELDRIKLAELENCNGIIRHMLEEALVYLINLEEFRALDLKAGVQIHLGEYRGAFEKIFETDEHTEMIGRWWHGIL